MEDNILLDQLGTLPKCNLLSRCEKNRNDDDENDEIDDSPFTVINNSCDYYQSSDLQNMLIQDWNALSLLCLNCQGNHFIIS